MQGQVDVACSPKVACSSGSSLAVRAASEEKALNFLEKERIFNIWGHGIKKCGFEGMFVAIISLAWFSKWSFSCLSKV